jgi:hypothetical protein
VSPKISILVLLVVVAVLSGCQANSPHAKVTVQVGGSGNDAASADEIATNKQKEEELRLAKERVKIAEERAELEKQKREFAEQQLKAEQETNETEEYQGSSASVSQTYSTPQSPRPQYSSHHSRSQPERQYSYMRWPCDEPLPDIGDIVEDDEGIEYEVVGRNGHCLKIIELDEN